MNGMDIWAMAMSVIAAPPTVALIGLAIMAALTLLAEQRRAARRLLSRLAAIRVRQNEVRRRRS